MATATYLGKGPLPTRTGSVLARLRAGDRAALLVTFGSAIVIFAIVAVVILELSVNSQATVKTFGWSFLTSVRWNPASDRFGALPFIYGTCVTSLIALSIAVPLGIGASIFLAEMAPPKVSNALTFTVELLAAVPSVIYGLLGIFILLPLITGYLVPPLRAVLGFLPIFQGEFYGVSLLSAGLILAIMIVPFIVSVSREVLLAVPRDQREASLALGTTRWETTWHIVLPNARTGIIGSVFLALARALGETMAVTMVIGNTPRIEGSLLAPGYSIAAVIANEFAEANSSLHISSLIFLGLVLFGLTIIINAVARLLIAATSSRGV